jgi:hypothetical protein
VTKNKMPNFFVLIFAVVTIKKKKKEETAGPLLFLSKDNSTKNITKKFGF